MAMLEQDHVQVHHRRRRRLPLRLQMAKWSTWYESIEHAVLDRIIHMGITLMDTILMAMHNTKTETLTTTTMTTITITTTTTMTKILQRNPKSRDGLQEFTTVGDHRLTIFKYNYLYHSLSIISQGEGSVKLGEPRRTDLK